MPAPTITTSTPVRIFPVDDVVSGVTVGYLSPETCFSALDARKRHGSRADLVPLTGAHGDPAPDDRDARCAGHRHRTTGRRDRVTGCRQESNTVDTVGSRWLSCFR